MFHAKDFQTKPLQKICEMMRDTNCTDYYPLWVVFQLEF